MKKYFFCLGVFVSCLGTVAFGQAPVDTMGYYRAQIDTLDKQIIDLIGQRTAAARAIGQYKMDHKIGVVQNKRFDKVLQDAIKRGKKNQLSEEFIRSLFDDVHKESIRQEEALKLKNSSAN